MNKLLAIILVIIFVSTSMLMSNDANASVNCKNFVTGLVRPGNDVKMCVAVLANGCADDGGKVVGKGSGSFNGKNTNCSLTCQICLASKKTN